MGKTIFRKIWIPSEKPVYAPVYSLFEIPSYENYLKTIRRVAQEGEFCNKYLDWSCVNKWGYVDLENIGSACNAKLSTLIPLSIAAVEGLWTISFLVKNT